MSATPKSLDCESLNDSWVDLDSVEADPNSKRERTPLRQLAPHVQSLERLLLDAQKETSHSSSKGSYLSSNPITPEEAETPRTPPNSLFFNNDQIIDRHHANTDWLWDWSNREQMYKDWNHYQPSSRKTSTRLSLRQWVIRRGILSKEVLSLLFLTNVLSLLLGAGIGYTVIVRKAL